MGKHSRGADSSPAEGEDQAEAGRHEAGLLTATPPAPMRVDTDAGAAGLGEGPRQRATLPPVPSYRPEGAPSTRLTAVAPSRAARHAIRDRRSRSRRRLGLVGIAGIAGVGLLAAAGTALFVRQATQPFPPPVATTGRTQTTVLLAVGDAGSDGDEAALLAADPAAHTASVALLPSRTLVAVPGRGQLRLGRAVAAREAPTAAGAVSDLLGVTVDGVWRLAPETLAALVDRVGGVAVDVPRDIRAGAVALHAGPQQRLGGTQAVAFAQSLDPAEDEAARLARVQAVLDGVLAALPVAPVALQETLAALGGGSQSSLPVPRLAVVLGELVAARSRAAAPVFSILPVTALDAGGDAVSYRVDAGGLKDYVAANLAASARTAAGAVRVFVYNGTLEYGVGTAARSRLVAAGLTFVGSTNDTGPGRAASVVLVRHDTAVDRQAGERVTTALGLPTSALQVGSRATDAADVVVLTGTDFHPAA